jgi:TetR/AcrR family transcriptional regulator, transcriptional repressor of aconitase
MENQPVNEIRGRIVIKCSEIFATQGFAKISMDSVARSLGMSKKTIYKYFATKEELVKTVILNFRDTTLTRIEAVLNDEEIDLYMRLEKVLEVTGEQLSKVQKPFLKDWKTYLPEFWTEIEEKRNIILKQVYARLISDGKKTGVILEDIDEDFFILMYMSLVTSIVNPEVMTNIPYTPSQVFKNIVKTLFVGILTDEARQKYQSKYLS